VSNNNTSRATSYLPQVAVATTVVAVLPVVVVWLLLVDGVVSSAWVCVLLAMALSFAASIVGSAYWKRRSGPGDILFSEVLLWGWLHRLRSERRLANAVGVLGLGTAQDEISGTVESVGRRAEILRQMAGALDAQDPYTDGHSRRVALHAAMIAKRMGLSREEVAKVRTAAAVHDIGKLRIPLEVLNKKGALTPTEFEIVKRHAVEGAEIVSFMDDAEVDAMVRHHHERFDGTGYPDGLMGERIPTGARIIAVADTFDALTSERPYRAAIAHKKALEIILGVSGTQLDPVAVRAFLRCYSGKRAVVFWTLLAVSPQRALGFLSGRKVGRRSLGSTATVAMPTALAALVAAAVGTVGTAAVTQAPLRLAQTQAPQSTAQRPPHHHRASHTSAGAIAGSAHKAAVLGSAVKRKATVGRAGSGARHLGSRPSSAAAQGHRQSRSGGVSPAKQGAGSGQHGGGGSHPGSKAPTHAPHPPPGNGGHPPAGSGAPPSPPASGGPPSGGSTAGNPGGGPGGGGGGPGNPGGGGGGGSGGSGGPGGGTGGGSGNPEPQSKQDCMNGGWKTFTFPNQGQCIAYVEHALHGQSAHPSRAQTRRTSQRRR
jgi:HD-GYP domain-containing protein (c-di-GMP phosphodiesterase class II)